ncbi:MAG TPA: VWA domain-containing protein [Terriglobales bacterium]|nr:VWA domain-containing protein [Terriglobales bacterium]
MKQSKFRNFSPFLTFALALALGLPSSAWGQNTQDQNTQDQSAQQPQSQSQPDAGGPQGDMGPIIVPKKKPEDQPPPPPPTPKVKNPEGMPDFSLHVDVANVQVPILVTTKDGQFIPGLKQDNFKIIEDGVPQTITKFTQQTDAPITAVLLVEFANNNYYGVFAYDAIRASYYFADSLKKNDWVAVISYDMKPYILSDFTQDKKEIFGAINQLQIPGFSETNEFDALNDTLDRLDRIEGRKYIILISTGRDTFSKINYDKILKKIKETPNVGIFAVSTGQAYRNYLEARGSGGMGSAIRQLDFLQADNEMNTFAKMTGGRWYHPTFEGELPEIFRDIATDIRNQYVITYKPTNSKQDGTFRKLKVELQAPDGGPLTVKDQKGKSLKPVVIARDGYTAKHEVE